MKWAYDLCGAEPIIKDEPVYDGAGIAYGELLMLGTTGHTVGTGLGALITAYNSTVSSVHAIDAVGISLEAKDTDSSPSVDTTTDTTAAMCYVKTIINPFAVYRAENTTAEAIAITSWVATHMVLAGVGDKSSGFVLYDCATAGPNFGDMRLAVVVTAAGTVNTDSGPTATATTADKFISVALKNWVSNPLNTSATGVAVHSTGTPEHNGATNLRVVESYIDSDTGLEILRPDSCPQAGKKKSGGKAAKFYSDICMKDHAFGVQEG